MESGSFRRIFFHQQRSSVSVHQETVKSEKEDAMLWYKVNRALMDQLLGMELIIEGTLDTSGYGISKV